jgi:hypothetical protein
MDKSMTVETPLALIMVGILLLQSQVCSKIMLSFQTKNMFALNRGREQRVIKNHSLKKYANPINKNNCKKNKNELMMMRCSNQGQTRYVIN